MDSQFDLIVIGGGPAGLVAAGKAARDGLKVLLLEKMEKTARKLRITGKGRCNITTTKEFDEFIGAINPNGNFLRNALKEFNASSIVRLLEELGVPTVVERGQRVFPRSGKAWDVAQALTHWAASNGAIVSCHEDVTSIEAENGSIKGVETFNTKTHRSRRVSCLAVIIATGGKSYPATGSTGSGYILVERLGHTITPLLPVLVGFETNPLIEVPNSLTLKNVSVKLIANGKTIDDEFGELEVMPYGLSGPIILKISREASVLMTNGKKCLIEADFKPALTAEQLAARLEREITENPRLNSLDLIRKLLPREMGYFILEQCGIAAQKVAARLTQTEKIRIAVILKQTRFELQASRGWNEAIVTMGGVSLREVDPKTMGSLKVKGLFFAGEILDLDGPTGGYNLQIAFSTGWLAGKCAASMLRNN